MKNLTRQRAALRISPIAAACSSLLLAATASQAQQAANPQASDGAQTIVVTGIRRAIETSIATKRNSDSIVEAISAEDIGKLPDVSIAESLARLPGLTAQRVDGRAQVISIRGMPPKFGGGLLNGREVVSSNEGREVEYDQFPSELIGQAIVYKTPDGELIGQGLSGTVDIRALSPLSVKGRQIAVNLRGEHNSYGTLVPGVASPLGKRFSASYIDQFADNTIGVSLGFAHLDSPSQLRQFQIWDTGDSSVWGTSTPGLPKAVNGGGYALRPMGIEGTAGTKSNSRDGLMAILEYKPNKDFHSQLDLYYSKFDTHEVGRKFETSLWDMWSGDAKNPGYTVANTQVVGRETFVTSGTMNNVQTVLQNYADRRKDDITSIGWNNSLKLGEKWTAIADVSMSRDTRNEMYYENFVAPYANGAWQLGTYDFNVPLGMGAVTLIPKQNMSDPSIMKMGDPMSWVGNDPGFAGNIRNPHITDEIKSFRLTGKRALDSMFSQFDFGLNYSQRDKVVVKNEIRLNMVKDASGNFIRNVPTSAIGAPTSMSAVLGMPPVMAIDVPAVIAAGALTLQPAFWNKANQDGAVHEKVTTFFGKLDIDTSVSNIPVRGNLGLQAIHTNQSSDGWVWLGDDGNPNPADLHAVHGGKSYSDLLPSLNLVFDFGKGWISRFGVGKEMARPAITDMLAGAATPAVNKTPGPGYGTWSAGSAGNPELEPWRANSVDLSVEKYIGKSSYLAAALYHKNLTNFIYTQNVLRDFSGFPNNSGVTPISNFGFASAPANGHGGLVEGMELSASLEASLLSQALDGFGIQANWSKVRSSLHDNNGNVITLDGLSGISDSVTAYYEKYGFSARVSQRYRSAYTGLSRDVFLNPTMFQMAPDKVVDMQLGYAFETGSLKGLSLLFQVNNMTDRPTLNLHSPFAGNVDSQTLVPKYISYFGRQIMFGVNYKM